jgi:microcystin-dependent protein
VQAGGVSFALDTGTANAMVVALTPVPTTRYPGMVINIKKGVAANSGAMTIDIGDGSGANTINRATGAAMQSGDMPAGTVAALVWDGGAWQYENWQPATSGAVTNNYYTQNLPYAADSGAANAYVGTFTPSIAAAGGWAAGLMFRIKIANANTGASTINADAHGLVNLVNPAGGALSVGQLAVGQVALCTFDGTSVQVSNLQPTSNAVPGTINMWATESAPSWGLECNGAAVSRSTYARLYGIISTMYGVGDGSTTFNLPDLRGTFVRGWDHAAGVDADRLTRTNRGDGTTGDHVGTKQAYATGSFTSITNFTINNPKLSWPVFADANTGAWHPGNTVPMAVGQDTAFNAANSSALGQSLPTNSVSNRGDIGPFYSVSPNQGDGGGVYVTSLTGSGSVLITGNGSDTRPVNVNLMYVIAI